LSEKSALRKVESETRLLEKIMLTLPGFKGYKEKEMRREADRLIRDRLGRTLEKNRNNLQEIYRIVVTNKLEEVAQHVDRVVTKLDRISAKVQHASYGYSGFFDAVKISEDDLDRMLVFDMKLLEESKSIDELVETFKGEAEEQNFGNALNRGSELVKALERFEENFDRRAETIKGLEA